MTFRKFDAGVTQRPKGVKNDCQVRALATATGIDWENAWHLLFERQRIAKACHFNLLDCLEQQARYDMPEGEIDKKGIPRSYLGFFGIEMKREISFPAKKGQERMKVADFCKKYPKGRFILQVANHVVAVKDGVFYDTWNCSHKCVYKAWEVTAYK